MADKPNFMELERLKERTVRRKDALVAEQRTDDDFYEGKFETKIKKPFWKVQPATHRRMIDTAVDATVSMNPIATVPPRKSFENAQANADLQEQWYQGWLDVVMEDSPDPVRETGSNIFVRGEAFYKVLWTPDDEFPITIQAREPMCVFPSASETMGVPAFVFEIYKRPAGEIRAKYPYWKSARKYDEDEMVEWVEFWSPQWRAFWTAGGAFALKNGIIPNIYKRVPYIHMYSGLGKGSKEGAPEKLAVSLIKHNRGMIQSQVRIMSFLESVIGLYSQRGIWILGTELPKGTEIDMTPGAVRELPGVQPDQFRLDEGSSPSPAVFTYLSYLSRFLEEGSVQDVLKGEAPQGIDVGYMYSLLSEQGMRRLSAPMKSMKVGLQRALGLGAYLLEKVHRKSMTVHTMKEGTRKETTIEPEDFDGYYKVNIKLSPEDTHTATQKALAGLRLWQGRGEVPGISMKRFLEDFVGIPNATDEMAQILAELGILNPAAYQIVGQRAMQKLGMEIAAQGQQAKGAGSQKGVPEGQGPRDMTSTQERQMNM